MQVLVCAFCIILYVVGVKASSAFECHVARPTGRRAVRSQQTSYLSTQRKAVGAYARAGKRVWIPALCQFLTFSVSLLVWPAIPGLACTNPGFFATGTANQWYFMLVLGMYNLGDFGGKSAHVLLQWAALHLDDEHVLLIVMARGAFLVPIILTAAAPQMYSATIANWVVLLALLILGFSNGFLATVGMMVAPRRVPTAIAEKAANIMVLSLFLGISCGTSIAWALGPGLLNLLPIGSGPGCIKGD